MKSLSRKRMAVSAAVVVLLLAGLAAIPIPNYIQAAVAIQPHDVRHIHTQVPGTLERAFVSPGDGIELGKQILKLSSPELEDRLRELESELDVQKQRERTAKTLSDAGQVALAVAHRESLQAQIAEIELQLKRLEITAPIAGQIVAAEAIPEPKHEPGDDRLSTWHGHPLQPENLGGYLEPRTHVCSIAPDDKLEAVLYIEQSDRNEVQTGQRIRLKFDHLPDRIYEGTIEQLSEQPIQYVPSALSNKSGGPLATVTDADGRERLTSEAWQAKVILQDDSNLFLSGFRGRARLVVTHRSAGGWIYHWLRKTIHFRM